MHVGEEVEVVVDGRVEEVGDAIFSRGTSKL